MRILEDARLLFGQGYTIIGGKKMHYETMNTQKCQPIRVYDARLRSETDNLDYLIDFFEFDNEDEMLKKDICDNFTAILRGKHPEWLLASCHVMTGCIYLVFRNTIEIEKQCCGYFWKNSLTLRFDILQPEENSKEEYSVSIEYDGKVHHSTTVQEDVGNMHREIDFYFVNPRETNPFKDRQYIKVTDYVNYH